MATQEWIPFHLRVGAVLSGMGMPAFTANARRLHTAFYDLTRKHGDLFPDMHFSVLSSYPYSRDLRSAIFRLQQSDALSADNPKWVRYQLQEEELHAKLEDVRSSDPKLLERLVSAGAEIRDSLRLTDEEVDMASKDKAPA